MNRRTMSVLVVIAGGLLVGASASLWPGHPVVWRSPQTIQSYLLSRTPLGSSVSEVVADLRDLGAARGHGEPLDTVTDEFVAN